MHSVKNWHSYLTDDLNLGNTPQEISQLKTLPYKILPPLPFMASKERKMVT